MKYSYMEEVIEPSVGGGEVTTEVAKPEVAETVEVKGFWNDAWRERLAAGDEKALKQLGRFASPEDIWKKTRALEQKFSSGEARSVLPKDASPEQIADYRKEIGIPESYDKYDLTDLPIHDEDKPIVDEYLKAAHTTNQTPEQVKASLKAYYAALENQSSQRQEQDALAQSTAEEELRGEWGGDYKRNINLIKGLLDRVGTPELKADFMGGRLADGTPIGSSPQALKMLVSLALIENPAALVVPAHEGGQGVGIEDEITKIEKIMNTDRKTYNKDEKMQNRYRDLLVARETMSKRK